MCLFYTEHISLKSEVATIVSKNYKNMFIARSKFQTNVAFYIVQIQRPIIGAGFRLAVCK